MTTGEQSIVKVTRVFDYPRESVFRMWTDPKKLAEWWGPEGCVNVLAEVDPRPGGATRVDQRFPNGEEHRYTAIFEKVIAPELLVYRTSMPSQAGFSAWEARETVTFEELGPRRTRMTAITEILAGPEEERESLKKAYLNGWGQSLEKLQRALR